MGLRLLAAAVTISVFVAGGGWPACAGEVPPSVVVGRDGADLTLSSYLDARSKAIRAHVAALIATLPHVPAESRRAEFTLAHELDGFGWTRALLCLAFAVGLGFGLEYGLRRAVSGNWRWTNDYQVTTATERLRVLAIRLVFAVASWSIFTVGSVGAFLALDWPPLLEKVLLAYLLALCGFRAVLALSRLILVPDIEEPLAAELRAVPANPEAARRSHLYVGLLAGWFVFGKATVENVSTLGFSLEARQLVAYMLGIGLLAVALHAVWRGRGPSADRMTIVQQFASHAKAWLLSTYFVLLWSLWVAGALLGLWLCAIGGTLWMALRFAHRAVAHVTRAPGAASSDVAEVPSIAVICTERAIRAILIIGAAALFVRVMDVKMTAMAAENTPVMRIVRTALDILIIALAADFIWNVLKGLIERRLRALDNGGELAPGATRDPARLRTLLPITKKLLAIIIFFMTALMMLSEAGFQIGPIIAGAGVIGLAVSFGAQTLVRDIFSGFFYLFDDAFRVGEYIQSGNYKGTVESFSIRSVRLRHHRGPLYTVPFGVLGAIQNMSRDWVIDILTVGVTYDTDLDAVRKIIKNVGQQLKDDPELAPLILAPLKMQGVQQFGDFAIQIRLKIMTRPGEQFVVRRRAYGLIKKEFDSCGIKFAFPTVQVAGGSEPPVAAAARQVLEMRGAGTAR